MKIIGLHIYGFALLGVFLSYTYRAFTGQPTYIESPIILSIGLTAILAIINGFYNLKKKAKNKL